MAKFSTLHQLPITFTIQELLLPISGKHGILKTINLYNKLFSLLIISQPFLPDVSMNGLQPRIAQPKAPPGLDYYIPHYLNLMWRWKWYVGIVIPIVFITWSIVVVKFAPSRPLLDSTVVLEFNKSGTNIQNLSIQRSTCGAFIRSRPFLETVVQKLSLQLVLNKYFMGDVFDSVSVEKNAPVGTYDFLVEKGDYVLLYTNKQRMIEKQTVCSGKLVDLSTLVFQSVNLKFTRDFLYKPHSLTFNILTMRDATDRVQWSISTKFPGDRESGTQGTIMTISFRGSDYSLATQIANTIADDFVAHNNEIIRIKKSGNIQDLEKQLQTARADLENAEGTLRQFREANLSVGTTSIPGSSINEVSDLENSGSALQRSIDDAQTLQSRSKNALSTDDKISAMFEAITFLINHQLVSAPGLQLELNNVSAEKRHIDTDYSPQHPLAIENKKKIDKLLSNISEALSATIDKQRTDLLAITAKRNNLSAEFQKLPAKEIRYADLERRRATATDMYTNILNLYNSSKMAEETETADITVLDHAVPPTGPSRLQQFLQLIVIGFFIALALGIGPAVGLDLLDKRARNEGDCRRFSDFPFLESIPEKPISGKTKPSKDKIDELLVAASFEPTVFDEMYRSLRTKILLHLYNEPHKMLVVTSMNVSEGKSLTSSNLSIVMAQQKLRTLLIDGDMRKGVQHHSFVLEKKPGLSEILSSPNDLSTIPVHSFIQKTHIPFLSLISSGMPIPNPAECMNSPKFHELTSILAESFDVIILDTPPLRVAVDAAILPEAFNHYIIVARAESTNLVALEKKVADFPGLRKKILGIVLNRAPIDKKMHNYSYSYYHQ